MRPIFTIVLEKAYLLYDRSDLYSFLMQIYILGGIFWYSSSTSCDRYSTLMRCLHRCYISLSLFSSWYKRSFSVSRCNIIPFVDATFLVNNETSCDLSGDCVREDGSITLSHGHSDPHSGRLVAYTWTALDDEALFEGKTQTFPSLEYQLLFARTAGSDIRSGDLRDEWEASTSD